MQGSISPHSHLSLAFPLSRNISQPRKFSLEFRRCSRSINFRNFRWAALTMGAFAVGRFITEAESPVSTTAQLKDFLYVNKRRNLLLATSVRPASCAIMRGFRCCADCLGDAFPPAYLKRRTASKPKTSREAERPAAPDIRVFQHHWASETTCFLGNRPSATERL